MYADAQLLIADSESVVEFDVASLSTEIQIQTSIFDRPGKMTFRVVSEIERTLQEGSNVVFYADGAKRFDGYLFERHLTEAGYQDLVAYDRLRYLNNKDSKVFTESTLDTIFETICTEQQLPFEITSSSSWVTSPVAHDNQTYYQMITRAIDETLINTQKYIIVRDNVGKLELIELEALHTGLYIGDDNAITGYNFTSSIDKQTYNFVKLAQEDKAKSVREVYITKDSENIYKWGQLQFFKKMNKKMNEAQIKQMADEMLKLFNRKTKELKFTCLGDFRVGAGSGIYLNIQDLKYEGVEPYIRVYVSNCRHRITQETHFMELEVEVP